MNKLVEQSHGTFIFVIICDKLDVGGNLYARIDCTEHMVLRD